VPFYLDVSVLYSRGRPEGVTVPGFLRLPSSLSLPLPFEKTVSPRVHGKAPTGFLPEGSNIHLLNPRMMTPAPTRKIPNHSLTVGRSSRKMTAKIATSTRLNLSTGATFEASPICNARK
jgi:hypothetical protein